MFKQWRPSRKAQRTSLLFHSQVSPSILSVILSHTRYFTCSMNKILSHLLTVNHCVLLVFSLALDKNMTKKAMMPPTPAPRKWVCSTSAPSSTSSTNSLDVRIRAQSESIGQSKSMLLHCASFPWRLIHTDVFMCHLTFNRTKTYCLFCSSSNRSTVRAETEVGTKGEVPGVTSPGGSLSKHPRLTAVQSLLCL